MSKHQNQAELNLVSLHRILVHLEVMAVGATATQNLDEECEEHGVVERKFEFDVTQVTGAILRMRGNDDAHVKSAIARRTLDMIVIGTQSGVIKSTTCEMLQNGLTRGLAFHRHRTQQER